MAHYLVERVTKNIERARQAIEDNYDDIHEPEFDLGFLFCLQSICDDLGTNIHFFNFQEFANKHFESVYSIEKGIIDKKNEQDAGLKRWARPIAQRIVDELDGIENNTEEHDKILSAVQKLIFHNPSFARAFIGTSIIEESYFDDLE